MIAGGGEKEEEDLAGEKEGSCSLPCRCQGSRQSMAGRQSGQRWPLRSSSARWTAAPALKLKTRPLLATINQTINTTDNRHFYKCLLTHSSWGRTLHPRDSSKYCLHLSTLSNFVYTQLWIIALRIGIITLLWRRTRGRRSCRMILNFLDSTFVRRQTEKTPE